jgi:hypothetical protein
LEDEVGGKDIEDIDNEREEIPSRGAEDGESPPSSVPRLGICSLTL